MVRTLAKKAGGYIWWFHAHGFPLLQAGVYACWCTCEQLFFLPSMTYLSSRDAPIAFQCQRFFALLFSFLFLYWPNL